MRMKSPEALAASMSKEKKQKAKDALPSSLPRLGGAHERRHVRIKVCPDPIHNPNLCRHPSLLRDRVLGLRSAHKRLQAHIKVRRACIPQLACTPSVLRRASPGLS